MRFPGGALINKCFAMNSKAQVHLQEWLSMQAVFSGWISSTNTKLCITFSVVCWKDIPPGSPIWRDVNFLQMQPNYCASFGKA
jgi:hypothetical protein